jgi:hypothetical protein
MAADEDLWPEVFLAAFVDLTTNNLAGKEKASDSGILASSQAVWGSKWHLSADVRSRKGG